MLLAGCAEPRLRTEADGLMRTGQYEQAADTYDSALKQYPDSGMLRSGSLLARAEAMQKLVNEAAVARAQGRLDEAATLLQRASRFDSGGKRVAALLEDLRVEQRQLEALAEAQSLAERMRVDQALHVIAQALKDNPRQQDLQALQRQLRAEQRRSQLKVAQLGLSEARPITLDFRDASLRSVLDVVTRNSGVNFVLDNDIRPDVRVTVLLRSVRVEDAIDLIVSTHQLAKKVLDDRTLLIYANTPEKQREYQEQVVRVFYLTSADAKGAAAFLKSILKIREPFVDERSNMLALREPPETIELADRLMALYDTADPEVVLDLEVLEISTNKLLELGVQLPDSFTLTPLPPSGAAGLTVSNLNHLSWGRVGVGLGNVLVNLKRQLGDVNTLANPRIRVHNKDKAKVLIGDKVPIVSATTGQTGFVADTVSYIDVGLKLDVEPTVFADDEVSIRIALEVSSIASQVTTKSGTLAYQIGTRAASTVLRLRDGETQLLAGLISKEERSSSNRIPGLGDLPVLGRLFGSQRDEGRRSELVLAVTPRIVRNVRRPDASESEMWIGTEAFPRIRAVGGLVPKYPVDAGVSSSATLADPSRQAGPGEGDVDRKVPPPVLSLRGPATVRMGEAFEVLLELDSQTPLRGMPLHLHYNPASVELADVEEANFFKSDGTSTSFTKAIDAAVGTARAGVLRNPATAVPGRGAVVKLRFRALKAGETAIELVGVSPLGLNGEVKAQALPQPLRVQVQ
jgi:general secretion pathway protein D